MALEKADSMVAQLKRGTLSMLILFLLRERDMYGYELAQTLEERSQSKLHLIENSLYGSLYRLMKENCISSYKEKDVARARVFYHLEAAGEAYLEKSLKEYRSISRGIQLVIGDLNLSEEE